MSNSNNQNSNSISSVKERNNIQHEPLFTELSSEAAATVEGGASFLFETRGVTRWLNIRENPRPTSRIIGYWYPNQKKRMRTPAITSSTGFRAFGLPTVPGWVSKNFVRAIPGTYSRN